MSKKHLSTDQSVDTILHDIMDVPRKHSKLIVNSVSLEGNTQVLTYLTGIKQIAGIQKGDLLMTDDPNKPDCYAICMGTTKSLIAGYKLTLTYDMNTYITTSLNTIKNEALGDMFNHVIKFNIGKLKYNLQDYDSFIISANSPLQLIDLQSGKYTSINIQEYIKKPSSWKNSHHLYYKCIDFKFQEVSNDPYLVGLFLGCHQHVDITTLIKYYLTYKLNNLSETLSKKYKATNIQDITNIFTNVIDHEELEVIGDTHSIPDSYLYNSLPIRIKLLKGIVDAKQIILDEIKKKKHELMIAEEKRRGRSREVSSGIPVYRSGSMSRSSSKSPSKTTSRTSSKSPSKNSSRDTTSHTESLKKIANKRKSILGQQDIKTQEKSQEKSQENKSSQEKHRSKSLSKTQQITPVNRKSPSKVGKPSDDSTIVSTDMWSSLMLKKLRFNSPSKNTTSIYSSPRSDHSSECSDDKPKKSLLKKTRVDSESKQQTAHYYINVKNTLLLNEISFLIRSLGLHIEKRISAYDKMSVISYDIQGIIGSSYIPMSFNITEASNIQSGDLTKAFLQNSNLIECYNLNLPDRIILGNNIII